MLSIVPKSLYMCHQSSPKKCVSSYRGFNLVDAKIVKNNFFYIFMGGGSTLILKKMCVIRVANGSAPYVMYAKYYLLF